MFLQFIRSNAVLCFPLVIYSTGKVELKNNFNFKYSTVAYCNGFANFEQLDTQNEQSEYLLMTYKTKNLLNALALLNTRTLLSNFIKCSMIENCVIVQCSSICKLECRVFDLMYV